MTVHHTLQMIYTFVKAHIFSDTIKAMKKHGLEELFRALADRTRLRLINLMSEGEICVCYFVEVVGAPQPKISRHLAYLRRAGIVSARREGKWMHYGLVMPNDPGMAAVFKATLNILSADKELQQDRRRLTRACCGPSSLIQLLGAPAPAFL